MRINEKHLASFATNNCPVDKEGYLLKRGEVNKSFQKRYFVLKGNLLFYFEKRTDKEPIGVIILEGCTVELSENLDSFTFELVFQGSGSRTYILSAETQEDMEAWMKAVTCANYEYMKLMVSELQQKLDEINAEQAVAADWSKINESTAKSKSSSNGPALIDLGEPVQSSQHSSSGVSQNRFNPFNPSSDRKSAKSLEEVDAFGAVPFVPNPAPHSPVKREARTFAEMHDEFGIYIREKMQDSSNKTPLVQVDPLGAVDLLS